MRIDAYWCLQSDDITNPHLQVQMDWIAAVRLGWDPTDFISAVGKVLAGGEMLPNLW